VCGSWQGAGRGGSLLIWVKELKEKDKRPRGWQQGHSIPLALLGNGWRGRGKLQQALITIVKKKGGGGDARKTWGPSYGGGNANILRVRAGTKRAEKRLIKRHKWSGRERGRVNPTSTNRVKGLRNQSNQVKPDVGKKLRNPIVRRGAKQRRKKQEPLKLMAFLLCGIING